MFTVKDDIQQASIDLSYFKEKFELEIEYLKKYLINNEECIVLQEQKLGDDLFAKTELEPDKESYFNDFYEKEIKMLVSFYYHSSITLIHSILENSLTNLCNLVRQSTRNRFALNNLGNRDLIGAGVEYLTLTTDLEFESIQTVYPDIKNFQKLRNIIIHQNSCYKDENEMNKLNNLFPNKLDFDTENKRFHITGNELVNNHLNRVKEFINILISHNINKTFLIQPIENN